MLEAHHPPLAAAHRAEATSSGEVALWRLIAGLVVVLTLLATTLISLCFLVAWLVTGSAIG